LEHFYRYYLLVVGLLGAFVSFLVYFGIHDANTSIAERRFTSAVSLYHTSLERLLHQTSGDSDGRNTISTDSNALTLLRKALFN